MHVGLAQVLYEWNDLEQAGAQVQQGTSHSQLPQQAPALLEGYLILARIHQAHGDPPGAQAAMASSAAAVPPPACPGPSGWWRPTPRISRCGKAT